jgi:cysteine dioxygenase
MIDSLEARLEEAIQHREMIDAMLRGINAFRQYKALLPAIPHSYTRTLLLKQPDFELVAMQWSPGSLSELHDHGEARCWVAVVEGTIEVENFERRDSGASRADLALTWSLHLIAGDMDHRLNPSELHRVRNSGEISAYSLQIYAPSIGEYRVFDTNDGSYTTAVANYDSVFNL